MLADKQGVGVISAQDAASSSQGVFLQCSGLAELAEGSQGAGQVAGGLQGVGVVSAEYGAAVVEDLLLQFQRLLQLPARPEIDGQVVRGAQRVGVMFAEGGLAYGQCSFEHRLRPQRISCGLQVHPGVIQQPGELVGGLIMLSCGIGGFQYVGE